LHAAAAAAASPAFPQLANPWGSPVLDFHFHYRRNHESMVAHMEGSGVARAVLLDAPDDDCYRSFHYSQAERIEPADRFFKFASADMTSTDVVGILRQAIRSGAIGFGELISRVPVDGPEMRKVYELAAELKVPLLLHFQEPTAAGGVTFNTGFGRLAGLLKEYHGTVFVGHAQSFWANISEEVPPGTLYPSGPVKQGGLTDRMLSEYPNLYADLSATSGLNALARDPDFSRDFLSRHQDKLLFGSDCNCRDGRGAGQDPRNPLASGKCIGRETLTTLKELSSPEVFRKITWRNGVKLLRVAA
jgi:uncharacterized protein